MASGFREIELSDLVGDQQSVIVSELKELFRENSVKLVSARDWKVLQEYQVEAMELHRQVIELKAEKKALERRNEDTIKVLTSGEAGRNMSSSGEGIPQIIGIGHTPDISLRSSSASVLETTVAPVSGIANLYAAANQDNLRGITMAPTVVPDPEIIVLSHTKLIERCRINPSYFVRVQLQPRAMAVDSIKVPEIVDLGSDDEDESTVSDNQIDANGSVVPKATIPVCDERPPDNPEENHSINTDKSPNESEISTEVETDSETSSEEGEEQSGDNSGTQDEEISDDARERDTEIGDGGCHSFLLVDYSFSDDSDREMEDGSDATNVEQDGCNSLTGQDDGPENDINQSRVVEVTAIPDYVDENEIDNVNNIDYDLDELISAYASPSNYVSVSSLNRDSSPFTDSGSPPDLYTIREEVTTTTTMTCTFDNMDTAAIQNFVRGLNLTGNFTVNVNQNQQGGEPQPTVRINEDDNDDISPAATHHHGVEIMELSD